MSDRPWLAEYASGIELRIHAQPGAKTSQIVGVHGGTLKIRLAAPPIEGRANAALCFFMADLCEIPVSSVVLLSGTNSRRKHLRLDGLNLVRYFEQLSVKNS